MQTLTTITHISHDDLVNLFSTAFYGSNYLSADYDETAESREGDCYEDIMARHLIKGGTIQVTDHSSDTPYGKLPHVADEDEECVTYYVNINDIIDGLERAANGKFHCEGSAEYQEDEKESARVSFWSLANEDLDFDLVRADVLMQIILFDEIIYG